MYIIFVSSHIILDMIGFVRHQKSCRIGLAALWTEASGRYPIVLLPRSFTQSYNDTPLDIQYSKTLYIEN